jgi:hypothetical protein
MNYFPRETPRKGVSVGRWSKRPLAPTGELIVAWLEGQEDKTTSGLADKIGMNRSFMQSILYGSKRMPDSWIGRFPAELRTLLAQQWIAELLNMFGLTEKPKP